MLLTLASATGEIGREEENNFSMDNLLY
jgi:hypothetical protein